ncbi:coiled-coil domain-containing protein 127a [Denticeps clupeoides]|uniref:Coiled-coil domain containing 127a n=1 Tax=Denticeps clupeoides TaxID=299321 RepID=A0AAY4CDZ5_9TELE|nr:coiled-coil domain-containing protein 127-like [Denticeps clupeoides]
MRDAADGGRWNCALLVPMLGLAAFRWIWTRESQKQIHDLKTRFESDMASVTRHMELKYRDTLTESQRAASHLELELEKEHQRVKEYRQCLAYQSRQLVEERRQLRQQNEDLQQEKIQQLRTGVVEAAFRGALAREEEWHQQAQAMLQELETRLVVRQGAFCSLTFPRELRFEMEKNLLLKVAKDNLLKELNLESDLRDIFKIDRHCADVLNVDKRKNGHLMWVYLKYWQMQIMIQKHKRAEKALMEAPS